MMMSQDVVTLSAFAQKLDEMKNLCSDAEHRRLLTRAVGDIHRVAVEIDATEGYGLYLEEAA